MQISVRPKKMSGSAKKLKSPFLCLKSKLGRRTEISNVLEGREGVGIVGYDVPNNTEITLPNTADSKNELFMGAS